MGKVQIAINIFWQIRYLKMFGIGKIWSKQILAAFSTFRIFKQTKKQLEVLKTFNFFADFLGEVYEQNFWYSKAIFPKKCCAKFSQWMTPQR